MNADNSIGFGLLQVAAIMSHHADQTLQSNLNFGYSQYKILSVIIEAGRYRQVDIAGILGQTEASISRQIKLMESDELVKIKLNANNRREHLVYVTLKGARRYEKATRVLNHLFQPIFNTLSENQLIGLGQSLSQIRIHLDNQ